MWSPCKIVRVGRLSFALLSLVLVGCGGGQGGFTQVTIGGSNSSSVAGLYSNDAVRMKSSTTPIMNGGIMIYFLSTNGTSAFSGIYLADETGSTTVSLPNGTYSVYTLGYTQAGLTGVLKCGRGNNGDPVALLGTDITIAVSLSNQACLPAFATTGPFIRSDFAYNLQPLPLKFYNCLSVPTSLTGSILPSTCVQSSPGRAQSLRITLPVGDYLIDPTVESPMTACVSMSSGSSAGTSVAGTQVLLPIHGDAVPFFPMPLKISAFDVANCGQSTTTNILPNLVPPYGVYSFHPYIGDQLSGKNLLKSFNASQMSLRIFPNPLGPATSGSPNPVALFLGELGGGGN